MVTIILIITAAMAKAAMDVLQFKFDSSVFNDGSNKLESVFRTDSFWNPRISWMNKYKYWPETKEKFFGSTTFLSFLTDGWHFMQFIFLTCMFAAVVLYTPLINGIVDFIIMRVVFGCVFELFYSKLFIKGQS